MSCVRVTIIAVERQCVLRILIEVLYSYLSLQHEKRTRSITLSSVACLVLPNISILFLNSKIFGKKFENKHLPWFCLQIHSELFLIKKEITYYHTCTKLFILSTRYSFQILIKLAFSRQIFEKIIKYQISWKSIQWESICYMRTDRRTDMTKLMISYRNFAQAPKCHKSSYSRASFVKITNALTSTEIVKGVQLISSVPLKTS
jgi:hypothetical protein